MLTSSLLLLQVRESARPPAKYHLLSQSWKYSFTQNSFFATLAAARDMCADYQIISHLLEVDVGVTAAGEAALTDLAVSLTLRLQFPENMIAGVIIITSLPSVAGGELGELQVRTGQEKQILHVGFWTFKEDEVTQSSLSRDSLSRGRPDALEDQILEEFEHLQMAPLSPEDLRISELHLQQLGGPQHRG